MEREIRSIEVRKIHPNRRVVCLEESIEDLEQSIRQRGQLEPVEISFVGESFRIMDGEKRWRACRRLGMTHIKAVIVSS
ncbi:ParB N-terminal domain-containing protein [Desulforhabdus sp. TSK]|uniref:ParB/RepB/Spo0J family partition protein n=1 Tax=Desulforhabdus sp. TSK TaxID=2925014 RepID=UPI001FC7EB05|nr:ParB N-terminal domain-containing protein [Desulforhabdus sp. TSK]GKT09849.1 hypothetical protein DSTSK_31540 [Desulforhabdus sp. TSK]